MRHCRILELYLALPAAALQLEHPVSATHVLT